MAIPTPPGRIPIPFGRRLRLLQTSLLPVIVWAGAVGLCVSLYNHQAGTLTVSALVEGRQSNLAPLVDARLVTMSVGLLDAVRAGDVLATLDDSEIRAELAMLHAQGQALKAQVDAEQARLELESRMADESRQLDLRRLQVDVENARLEIVNRRIQIETSRVDLNRLHVEKQYSEQLMEAGVRDRMEYDVARVQAEALEKALEEGESALNEARKRLDESMVRLEKFQAEVTAGAEMEVALGPFRQELDVLAAEVDLVRTRLPHLVLRSPLDGVVTLVAAMPGENVPAGIPILTVSEQAAETLVAYLPENAPIQPQVGDEAEVRSSRPGGGVLAQARVLSISTAVQMLPERLYQDPNRPEFGQAVRLSLGSSNGLLPGQRATVTFRR